MTNVIPKRVFIVPYRDRIQQKFFFSKQMEFILECCDDYEILFVHQCDNRNFNRGAMKNIGFLAIKEKYPEHYKDISFIFNDVDTLPFHKLFDYETRKGVVKHHYGFATALGGIVVMKGSDFELVNGYPNYWGWGMEDACLQKRCLAHTLVIDRSNFYPIGSPEILQLFDGVSRLVCQKDQQRMKMDNGLDGLKTIHKLSFSIDKSSLNPNDNKYVINNNRFFVVNVLSFMTTIRFESDTYHQYDLRDPISKILQPDNQSITNKTHISPKEWAHIPYNQAANQRALSIQQQRNNNYNQIETLHQPQQVEKIQQQIQQQLREIEQQQKMNVFSARYTQAVKQKSKVGKSANIGLGGVR